MAPSLKMSRTKNELAVELSASCTRVMLEGTCSAMLWPRTLQLADPWRNF